MSHVTLLWILSLLAWGVAVFLILLFFAGCKEEDYEG